jgi:hypothetical protein
MKIGVRGIQNLLHPMDQLYVWVAAHLAEYRRTLDRFVGETVELSEKGCAFDLCH